jgi:hypothetical protein
MTVETLNFLGGLLSFAGPLIALAHWMLIRLADEEMILVERGMRSKPPYVGVLRNGRNRRRSTRKGDGR